MAEKVVLAACFPGCGWNGEVSVDADEKWTCPGCGKERQFKDHRAGLSSTQGDGNDRQRGT